MSEHIQKKRVGAGFQAVIFLVTFTLLTIFFTLRYNTFITHDPYPQLLPNNPTNKTVAIGINIAHFSTFNIEKNTFIMDGTLWFGYNPKEVSLDKIKKFSIFNGELNHVSEPVIIDHNGISIAQFLIRTTFHTPLNYRMFPLDDHRINLMIINNFLPKDVMFVSEQKDIVFSESLYIPGWHILGRDVRTGIRQVVLEKDKKQYSDIHQEAIITLECERTDPSLIINILLTLLLMLFISVLTFSSDEDSVLIVTVGIVALISYRSVMQTIAPPQVSYFMFSDYMYLLTLSSVIITLFCGIMTRERNSSIHTKKLAILFVYALFSISCVVIALLP